MKPLFIGNPCGPTEDWLPLGQPVMVTVQVTVDGESFSKEVPAVVSAVRVASTSECRILEYQVMKTLPGAYYAGTQVQVVAGRWLSRNSLRPVGAEK